MPNSWTCDHAKYNDGVTCDCTCGFDPDCEPAGSVPVAGCGNASQVCNNDSDTCVTPPANDTCASATAIVINTPVNGTTVNAADNYDAGLDGMGATCTTYPLTRSRRRLLGRVDDQPDDHG